MPMLRRPEVYLVPMGPYRLAMTHAFARPQVEEPDALQKRFPHGAVGGRG